MHGGRHKARNCTALLSGTSSEYLGRRALPRLLQERPFLVILGPHGTGKTSVARRLMGPLLISLRGEALQEAAASAVRRRRWPDDVRNSPSLLIDGPTLLNRRPGAVRLLQSLILERCEAGYRTVVCQGDGDNSVILLLDGIPENLRVTLNLRFPAGRGRVKFASRMCQQLQIDRRYAREVQPEDGWTYLKVIRALHRIKRDSPVVRR